MQIMRLGLVGQIKDPLSLSSLLSSLITEVDALGQVSGQDDKQ